MAKPFKNEKHSPSSLSMSRCISIGFCIRVLVLLIALTASFSMGYWFGYKMPEASFDRRGIEFTAPQINNNSTKRSDESVKDSPDKSDRIQPRNEKSWSELLSDSLSRATSTSRSGPREISELNWSIFQCTSNISTTNCQLQQAMPITSPEKIFWGNRSFQKDLSSAYEGICRTKTKRCERVKRVQSRKRAPPDTLIQTSISSRGVGFEIADVSKVPKDKATIYDSPTCDLRRCDQSRYPFIYFLLPERNRVGNAERMILSMKNATARCDVAPWLPCFCFYVIDYNTTLDDAMIRLQNAWPGHVRVLGKQQPTDPWMKAQALSYGSYSIPTPAERSFVFHVDADLVALDDGFVDNALDQISDRARAYLPIVRTTKKSVQDVETLWKEVNHPNSPSITWRMPGVGMVFYLLGDFRTEFPYVIPALPILKMTRNYHDPPFLFRSKSSARKTDWGSEDWDFYAFIRRKLSSIRKKEEWLIHIYHPKVSWRGSQDGITLG